MSSSCAVVERRPAEPRDAGLLRQLFGESRADLALLPAELVDLQVDAQRRQYDADFPLARYEILTVDGVDVGRLVVDVSGPAVRVVDVVVSPAHRRRGIARAVLGEVVAAAHQDGRAVALSVWADDAAAVALYAGLGFTAAGRDDVRIELEHHPEQEDIA